MNELRELEQNCSYSTPTLYISPWDKTLLSQHGIRKTVTVLSPEVTLSLPPGWQNLTSSEQISQWLNERIEESALFTITTKKQNEIIGFLLLYPESYDDRMIIRLGYILGKEHWGHGYATELIEGLVKWCRADGSIVSIIGGVETDNPASARVLEKNDFIVAERSQNTITYELRLIKK